MGKGAHILVHRDRRFVDLYAAVCRLCQLAQYGAQAAPGNVPQGVHFNAPLQQGGNHIVQGGAVGLNGIVHAHAGRKNGCMVVAHGTADQQSVSRL